jgi:serine phosphatase RsbU (regulator of sigma subunit)
MLEPGDVLLLFTDGVTEAEDSSGRFFGEERLRQIFEEVHHLPPQQVIDEILLQARLFTGVQQFNDDVSLVVMKVNPATGR